MMESFPLSGMAKGKLSPSFFFPAMLVSICFLLLLSTANANGSNETDRQALLEMKTRIIDDPLGILSSWNDSIHFCRWYGVTCGRRHQRVISLDLSFSKLGGSIPPHIGNLSFLRKLDIGNNAFRGEIPPEFGRLGKLQELYLHNNSLSGDIPSNISRCSNLNALVLSGNKLEGKIPEEIGGLPKLEYLYVGLNNLAGFIPSSFGNLSCLLEFFSTDNSLTGNIPDTLGQLGNLKRLDLFGNQLSGIVPSSIFNLSSIVNMDLGRNQLIGNISSSFFISFPNLQFLSTSENHFTGSIHATLSNASKLVTLQMAENNLTGQVPNLERLNRLQKLLLNSNHLGSGGLNDLNFLCSLTNTSTLKILHIRDNNFGGDLPECIANLSTKLSWFGFGTNKIHGSIPSGIGSLVNLQELWASDTNLSGIIPHTIGNLQNLNVLALSGSLLSGRIPTSLGNLTKLIILDLAGNNLQGVIPSSLGECRNLLLLDLSQNDLDGTLPPEVMGISSLSIYLGLSQNHLTGSIPREVGKLVNLRELDVSNNMLSGEIPEDLGSCESLQLVYLERNLFQGPVSSSLRLLRALQELDLSNNNLSGQIPEFFASFKLITYLNLSFNELEGIVPTEGVFKNASTTSVMGNKLLCGGIPEFHLPICRFHNHKNRRLSSKLKVIIASVSGILGVSLVLFLIFLLRFRKKKEKLNSSDTENSMLKVSYHDLHNATNGFSVENLLGAGSFGSVYKGILKEGRKLIAIKVFNLQQHAAEKSFFAECEALRNIRHRNLVKVSSACSGIDYQGYDFKALVYEFMVNGSLEDWLHPSIQDDSTHQAPTYLTICQRLNISLDVALALEYLHFGCETAIIHCDLKPSNILLDEEFIGHVSDFGVSKFLSKDIQIHSTNQSSSIVPLVILLQYGFGSDISTNGDVYSYGIMLLEIFTRKKPTDEIFKNGWNLHNFAKKSLSDGGVVDIIDPILLQEIGEMETSTSTACNRKVNKDRAIECLFSIIEVGVACSTELPADRMNMREVTTKLYSIQNKLLS